MYKETVKIMEFFKIFWAVFDLYTLCKDDKTYPYELIQVYCVFAKKQISSANTALTINPPSPGWIKVLQAKTVHIHIFEDLPGYDWSTGAGLYQ